MIPGLDPSVSVGQRSSDRCSKVGVLVIRAQ